ncbi:hypothetical protein [Saccharopolyspora sp. 5N708]|uniref:hypothetical protein n=1 Tax=Saccharopolyspora sp. 5N708 TaxID=3457424 RepID=UPI003FD45A7C
MINEGSQCSPLRRFVGDDLHKPSWLTRKVYAQIGNTLPDVVVEQLNWYAQDLLGDTTCSIFVIVYHGFPFQVVLGGRLCAALEGNDVQ